MSRARMVYMVFFITAALILTVYLRSATSRTYYEYRISLAEQERLAEQLKKKQLELEHLTHPQRIYEQMGIESEPQP